MASRPPRQLMSLHQWPKAPQWDHSSTDRQQYSARPRSSGWGGWQTPRAPSPTMMRTFSRAVSSCRSPPCGPRKALPSVWRCHKNAALVSDLTFPFTHIASIDRAGTLSSKLPPVLAFLAHTPLRPLLLPLRPHRACQALTLALLSPCLGHPLSPGLPPVTPPPPQAGRRQQVH